MKILIIEDDVFFTKKLEEFFQKNNIEISISNSGEEGMMKIKNNIFDVIILDMNLPGMSGKKFITEIRQKRNHTPIIILSSVGEISKKAEALKLGCDDYMMKPCHGTELLARIEAVIRRSNHKTAENIIRVGKLSLNLQTGKVKLDNKIFPTTKSEHKIIELMMRNKGNIISKENFMGYIYTPEQQAPHPKILDVFVCKLRNKIEAIIGTQEKYIETHWGIGYQLLNIPPVYYDHEEDEVVKNFTHDHFDKIKKFHEG